MPWPAFLGAETSHGTCYLPGRTFPEILTRMKPHGQAWRYNRVWTTYRPRRDLLYKNVDRFFKRDEQQRRSFPGDFWALMGECQRAGINPPTSFADMWMSCCRVPLPRLSVIAPFRRRSFGGWEIAPYRGAWPHGRVYQYDLNRAYRWAASLPLPDMRSGHRTTDFTAPLAVYLVRVPFDVIPWARSGGVVMLTSEERDALAIQTVSSVKVLYGVAFRKTFDLTPMFAEVDRRFPLAAKRIGQRFWSMWNTWGAPEQVSWKNGERVRQMRNPFYNPIWSAFITSRIKIRLNAYRQQALQIFVDSLFCTNPDIPTGDEMGAFKLAGVYDQWWIRSPGYWGDGEHVLRHSGAKIEPTWVSR